MLKPGLGRIPDASTVAGAQAGVIGAQLVSVHAPNTVGNFCFEVTLGYRRLERGR